MLSGVMHLVNTQMWLDAVSFFFIVCIVLKLIILPHVGEAILDVVEKRLQFLCSGQLRFPNLMETCSCQT